MNRRQLLLASAILFAKPSIANDDIDSAYPGIHYGEIALTGYLNELNDSRTSATMNVARVFTKSGGGVELSPPRVKTVVCSGSHLVSMSNGVVQIAPNSQLRTGIRATAIGIDLGVGKPMPARVIVIGGLDVLFEDTHRVPGVMARQGDPPHDETPRISAENTEPVVPSSLQDINSTILHFCENNLGVKIGSGQCSDLVVAALQDANGSPMMSGRRPGASDDYVWGRFVYGREIRDSGIAESGNGRDVRAGDMIQFSGVEFSFRDEWSHFEQHYQHHSAVIRGITAGGQTVQLYEQNSNNRLFVTKGEFHLPYMREGSFKIYRAIPRT